MSSPRSAVAPAPAAPAGRRARIAVLAGDGIGPEVVGPALDALESLVPLERRPALVGGAALDNCGDPLPAETLALCQASDAVFLGAVGGPRWERAAARPEQGLLRLRRELGLFANLRPVRDWGLPGPLAAGHARGADLLLVRDLAGGVYFGEPRGVEPGGAFDTWRQSEAQVRAVGGLAFGLARGRRRRLTSVDKANVLESSRLWRRVLGELGRAHSDVELEHRYVDSMAFELLRQPRHFDVLVTDNLFGDILSDEAGAIAGSLGLLPSASLGPGPGLFEPVHGSAPDIAGRGLANPTGAYLSAALLAEHALGQPQAARALEHAVAATLRELRTPDLGGDAGTARFAQRVEQHLAWTRHAVEDARQPALWGV